MSQFRFWIKNFCWLVFFISAAHAAPRTPKNFLRNGSANLILHARMSTDTPELGSGVEWRIYATPESAGDDSLLLIKTSTMAKPHFSLKPGTYFICANFGRATAIKRVSIMAGHVTEALLTLDAGGLIIGATIDSGRIDPKSMYFSVYKDATENLRDGLILSHIPPGTIVRLSSGTYHLLGRYGNANAIKRAEVKVQAGRLTQVSFAYKAAQVSFKLTHTPGGIALADTHWSIMDEEGETIFKTVGAFVSAILAEGHYTAIAQNSGKNYHKDFVVVSGNPQHVEVLTKIEESDESDDYSID